jgi:hypothetical protein
MKTSILFLIFFTLFLIKAQRTIADTNFQQAINACLSANSVDGMYSNSACGAIPHRDALRVTNISGTFNSKSDFSGDL